MKKRLIFAVLPIVLILSLLTAGKVFATTSASVTFETYATTAMGNEFDVQMKVHVTDTTVEQIGFDIRFNNNLVEYKNFTASYGKGAISQVMQDMDDAGLLHAIWTGSDESTYISDGDTLLFTVRFKAKTGIAEQTTSITPSNVSMIIAGTETKIASVTTTAASTQLKSNLSDDCTLKNIQLSIGTLSPSFSSGVTSYSVNVSNLVNKISISGTTTNENASIVSAAISDKLLSTGNNVFTITVRSEMGTEKTYTVTVNRAKSAVNTIASIQLSTALAQLSPAFSASENNYNIYVPHDVDEISITGTLTSNVSSTVWVDERPLAVGDNEINIVVTAENGAKNTYTFTVNREEASHESTLGGASILGEAQVSPIGNVFRLSVPNAVSTTAVQLFPASESITSLDVYDKNTTSLTLSGDNVFKAGSLVGGDNEFKVIVTAEDGITKTEYRIIINRAKSDDCALKYLRYKFSETGEALPIQLFNDTTEYEISDVIYEQSNIIFFFEQNNAKATLASTNEVISGKVCKLNESTNTVFLITVVSESGIERTYTVTVKKAAPSSECQLKEIMPITLDNKGNEVGYTSEDYWFDPTDPEGPVFGLEVPYEAERIYFQFKTSHAYATTESDCSEYKVLTAGAENLFRVTVTAQDGVTTKSYRIIVTRRAPSSDCTISDITVSDSSIEEADDPETDAIEYNAFIPYGIDKVKIEYVINDLIHGAKAEILSVVVPDEYGYYEVGVGQTVQFIIQVTAQNGDLGHYVINASREKCNDNTLKRIQYQLGEDSDVFDLDLSLEELEIRVLFAENFENIQFFYEKNHETATVAEAPAFGEEMIVSGKDYYSETIVTITVTAQNGEEKDYIIHLRRELPSTDNYLKTLYLSTGNLNFSPSTKVYKLQDFPYAMGNFDLYPVQNDSLSTVEVKLNDTSLTADEFGVYNVSLAVGNNTLEVIVTAQSGQTRKYSIAINRIAPEINNDLSALKPTAGEFNETFSQFTTTYSMFVPYTTKKIGFNYTIRNAYATAVFYEYVDGVRTPVIRPEIDDPEYDLFDPERTLAIGLNQFEIVVTAQNGKTKTYKILVTRGTPSVDSTLAVLEPSIGELSPAFDPAVTEYNIEVANKVSSIEFNYAVADSKSVCTMVCSSLDGKLIEAETTTFTFTVEAEDESTTVYTVNVFRRAKSGNATLEYIRIDDSDLVFNPTTYTYDVRVLRNYEMTFNIRFEAADDNAIVEEIGTKELLEDNTNVYRIKVTAENGETHTYTLNITMREAESDSKIKILYDDKGIIEFDPEITEYTYTVPFNVNYLYLEYKLSGEFATETHNFPSKLIAGDTNDFVITVLAEDGTNTKYTFHIIRSYKSGDSTLSMLEVEGFDIGEFSSEETTYYLNVPYYQDSIRINYKASSEYAKVTENFPAEIRFDGKNTFEVIVTAENGTSTIYEIIVYRDAMSNDSTLKSLTVANVELLPEFDNTVTKYTATVPYSVTNVELAYEVNYQFATVEVKGSTELSVGENVIEIIVTAQDETTTVYTVTITRVDRDSDSTLKILSLDGAVIPFTSDVLEYTVEVRNNVKTALFTYEANSKTATVEFSDDTALEVGVTKMFTFKVTAENGTVTEYRVNVTRREISDDTTIKNVIVNGETFAFIDGSIFTLPYSSRTVNLAVETNDEAAIAVIDNKLPLETGENNIAVTVTAESGKIQIYYIIIARETGSSINYINDLVPSAGELDKDFDRDIIRYRITVGNKVETIDFDITLADEKATYTVSKNTLDVGENNISIEVTSENGLKRTYYIEVIREEPPVMEQVLFSIGFIEVTVLGTIVLSVIGVGTIFGIAWFGIIKPKRLKAAKLAKEAKAAADLKKPWDKE